jgi:hypothetical protein
LIPIPTRRHVYPFVVDQDSVGLHAEVGSSDCADGPADLRHPFSETPLAKKQRLPAVQYDVHVGQSMAGRMRGDAIGQQAGRRGRHELGLIAVGAIRKIVHVAVAAIQIAAARHLDDESCERNRMELNKLRHHRALSSAQSTDHNSWRWWRRG